MRRTRSRAQPRAVLSHEPRVPRPGGRVPPVRAATWPCVRRRVASGTRPTPAIRRTTVAASRYSRAQRVLAILSHAAPRVRARAAAFSAPRLGGAARRAAAASLDSSCRAPRLRRRGEGRGRLARCAGALVARRTRVRARAWRLTLASAPQALLANAKPASLHTPAADDAAAAPAAEGGFLRRFLLRLGGARPRGPAPRCRATASRSGA